MSQRDVEVPAAGESGQSQRAIDQATGLGDQRTAAVPADRDPIDPVAVAELERLRKVPRRHLDVVARGLQAPDHRRHHEHVRRVGEVDPDLQSVHPGLLAEPALRGQRCTRQRRHNLVDLCRGQHRADRQRDVGARELVGDPQLGRSGPSVNCLIAGCRCSGVR